MKLSAAESESIIALMTRFYIDIRDIEEEFQLLIGGSDFRPRIEYFHDAIRAFTSKDAKEREEGGRLSVEFLAYDLKCLRYIQSMPLSSFKPHSEVLSTGADLVAVKPSLTVKSKRPGREDRERLAELYQHYAVLFAALLKPFADKDYLERIDDLNQDVADIKDMMQQLEQLGQGKGSLNHAAASASHLEDDEMRLLIQTFLQHKKYNKKEDLKKLAQFLKQQAGAKDKTIKSIESAHLEYAMAQLAIFEDSKDMLKKMAAQGMNLVGRFVADAMRATQREMGR